MYNIARSQVAYFIYMIIMIGSYGSLIEKSNWKTLRNFLLLNGQGSTSVPIQYDLNFQVVRQLGLLSCTMLCLRL